MIGRRFGPLGDFAYLAAGESVAKAAGFVAFAWMARRLGPAGYGAVEVAVSVALIGGLVVDGGLGPVAARAVARAPERAARLAALLPALRLTLAIACCAVVAAALRALAASREHRLLILVFALSLVPWSWNQNWLCQGLARPALAAAAQPVRMGIFALGAVWLVRRPDHLLRVGWLECGAVLALALYFLWTQSRLGVPVGLRFDRREMTSLVGEALPVGLGQLFWAAAHALPILMTAALAGGDQVAWIGAAVRIVLALHAFVWLYYFALYPRLVSAADSSADDLRPLLRGAQSRILWLVMPVAVAGSTGSGLLSRLVFGSGFTNAGSTLQIALWALPVAAASGVCRFLLIAAGRQRREMAAAAAGVFTVTLCGLLLIPRLAAPGAALALVAGGLVHWGVAAGLAWRSISSEPGVAGALFPALAALLALAGARLSSAAGPTVATAAGLGIYAALALAATARRARKEPL